MQNANLNQNSSQNWRVENDIRNNYWSCIGNWIREWIYISEVIRMKTLENIKTEYEIAYDEFIQALIKDKPDISKYSREYIRMSNELRDKRLEVRNFEFTGLEDF